MIYEARWGNRNIIYAMDENEFVAALPEGPVRFA